MTRLRQMMLEELQRRNYSKSTTRYYLQAVANFARHFGKSPDKLGPDELRSYQAYLLRERKLAVGFQPFAWRERQGARGRIPSGGRDRRPRRPANRAPSRAEKELVFRRDVLFLTRSSARRHWRCRSRGALRASGAGPAQRRPCRRPKARAAPEWYRAPCGLSWRAGPVAG